MHLDEYSVRGRFAGVAIPIVLGAAFVFGVCLLAGFSVLSALISAAVGVAIAIAFLAVADPDFW